MNERPIIMRRRKSAAHGHHGGAWKIAFADFMTALMALFLVLWVLSNASKSQKNAVADYFSTPLLSAINRSEHPIPGGTPALAFKETSLNPIELPARPLSEEEFKRLAALRQRLQQVIQLNPALKDLSKQILMELTPEGLNLQLIDSEQRPMFELGSARVAPYMRTLLRTIAPVLNELPNSVQISGHTDSHPYAGGEAGYSNWELSADRAKASRLELVSGGLDSDKLLRISGMADRIPTRDAQPLDAANRRIEITVLDSQVARKILSRNE